jgi:Tfp pilus assembly protein PilO
VILCVGYLEPKEYRKIIRELYTKLDQKLPSKSEIDEMIESIDLNGDHKLDKEEFKEHTRSILHSMLNGTLGM